MPTLVKIERPDGAYVQGTWRKNGWIRMWGAYKGTNGVNDKLIETLLKSTPYARDFAIRKLNEVDELKPSPDYRISIWGRTGRPGAADRIDFEITQSDINRYLNEKKLMRRGIL